MQWFLCWTEFERRKREREEERRRKVEEERRRKLVIDVDAILKSAPEKGSGHGDAERESEGDSDGGYMTDSSEEEERRERAEQERMARIIEENEHSAKDRGKETKKRKKKKKKKRTGMDSAAQGAQCKEEDLAEMVDGLSIYRRFRSRYTTLVDVEATHHPHCCLEGAAGGDAKRGLDHYRTLMVNEYFRQKPDIERVGKTIYIFTATKLRL